MKSAKTNKALFKNALVSVSNKEGLVDFIHPLAEQGMRVVSTGGTADTLKKAGIPVVEINQQTGFNEVMNGRVKSLHPYIYMPILARPNHPEDTKTLKLAGLSQFDLIVCNLYPFAEKKRQGKNDKALVDWIDVGGPTLLRAAAKNFERVTVLCDPADYKTILENKPDLKHRRQLAGKAFSVLALYNFQIAEWMQKENLWKGNKDLYLHGRFFKNLRYGENPGQKARWFQIKNRGLQKALLLNGKELSFNNICDLDSAIHVIREFNTPSAVAIKHNNPCGLACNKTIEKAIELTLKADPISVFGAVVAINRPVCEIAAELLCSLFLEAIVAPDYSPSALALFKSKKQNLRLMKWPDLMIPKSNDIKIRTIDGGLLVQESPKKSNIKKWQYIDKKPGPSVHSELLIAWKVCTHLKSNAIALVSNKQTVGLGMGQVNRISAVETAIQRWKSFHPFVSSPVMASDGFFPFSDSVKTAAQAGIKWIIQPGGSIRDQEVISKAKKLSVNMIFTGQRGFSH